METPTTTTVRLRMLDGREHAFETRTYMCTADRVAFERRFQVNSGELSKLGEIYDEAGRPRPGADLGAFRDEWIAFFTWRVAARHVPALAEMAFDAFVEELAEVELDTTEGEAMDPTAAAPRPA